MTIIKRAKPTLAEPGMDKALDKVIQSAPDGARPKGVHQGNKRQITVGFDPEFLDKIDESRKEMGLSRPAFLTLACQHLMSKGIVIGGRDDA